MNTEIVNSLCLGVIFSPTRDELVQMVRSQDRPITCEVVEVVHNYGHKEIDDLQYA